LGGVEHPIGTETDGHRLRYYIYHPWLKTPSGAPKKIPKYTRGEIIKELETAWKANTVNLSRTEYGPLATARTVLDRVRKALQAVNQSAETIVSQVRQQLQSLPNAGTPPIAAPEAQSENAQPPAEANRPPANRSPSAPPESATGAKPQPPLSLLDISALLNGEQPTVPESEQAPGRLTYKELAVLVLRAHGPLGSAEILEKGWEMDLADRVVANGSDRVASLRTMLNKAAMNPASEIERRDGKFQLKQMTAPAQNSATEGKPPKGVKFVRKDPIPPPPRKPNGRIDWKNVPTALLAKLVGDGPIAQIAQAWEVSSSVVYKYCYKRGIHANQDWSKAAAQQSQERLAALFPPAQPAEQVVKRPMPWDGSKAKFWRMLWEIGGGEIARRCDCNQASVYYNADKLKLDRPRRNQCLKKDRKIPDDLLRKIEQLEAEEAEAEMATQRAQSNGGAGGAQ